MKTRLTDFELKLVTDPEILLAKNRIIQQVYDFFGDISAKYQKALEKHSNLHTALTSAKISKGENYLGLPYVILDFPREFAKENVFAIRSFFWWGNFFSITLHLSGLYRTKFATAIEKAIAEKQFEEWHIATGQNQWSHHFEGDNYTAIEDGKSYHIDTLPFVKVAKKIPLIQWDEAELFFIRNFNLLIEILKT